MDDIRNSVWFNQYLETDDGVINQKIDYLYDHIGISGTKGIRSGMFSIIVLNLWKSYEQDKTRYVSYHRNVNEYSHPTTNNSRPKITKLVLNVIDELEKKGWIENIKGSQKTAYDGEKYVSRMRGTEKLFIFFDESDVKFLQYKINNKDEECIVLRKVIKQKGTDSYKKIPFNQTEKVKEMKESLIAYNKLLRNTFISIPDYPENGVEKSSYKHPVSNKRISQRTKIDPHNKWVSRKFLRTTDFKQGGRFYGGFWLNIKKEWRSHIFINDEPTVELDFSSYHLILMYGLEGIDYWKEFKEDPYQLSNNLMKQYYPEIKTKEQKQEFRNLMKLVVLILVNAKDIKSTILRLRKTINVDDVEEFGWFKELYYDIRDYLILEDGNKLESEEREGFLDKYVMEDKKLEQLVNLFREKHQSIKKWLNSGKGSIIQNYDSCVASKVINHFTNKKIPVLCIHDSFIVQKKYEQELKQVMTDSLVELIKEKSNHLLDKDMVKIKKKKGILKSKHTKTYKKEFLSFKKWIKQCV